MCWLAESLLVKLLVVTLLLPSFRFCVVLSMMPLALFWPELVSLKMDMGSNHLKTNSDKFSEHMISDQIYKFEGLFLWHIYMISLVQVEQCKIAKLRFDIAKEKRKK